MFRIPSCRFSYPLGVCCAVNPDSVALVSHATICTRQVVITDLRRAVFPRLHWAISNAVDTINYILQVRLCDSLCHIRFSYATECSL